MSFPRLIDDGSVWIVVTPPVIWAAHFLLCYWIAAIWCAAELGALAPVRWAIAALTVAALAAIGWTARIAITRYSGRFQPLASYHGNDDDARKSFLGHVALLLSALNSAAVILTAAPAMVFAQC